MTYDALDGYVLLFGGLFSPSDTQPGDTWTYLGGTWTNITATACPSGCPSPRFGSAMTYDALDGYVLLFGGDDFWASSEGGFLSDTWSFAGGVWTPLSPSCVAPPTNTCPDGRYDASMTYDVADSCVLMFGGAGLTGWGLPLDDAWCYAGDVWTLLSADLSNSGGPSGREGAGMTYDAKDGYVLLYGGVGGSQLTTLNSETWEYTAATGWVELSSSSAPGDLALINDMMVYDSTLGEVLLFGGATAVSPFQASSTTWTYVGGTWSSPAVGAAPSGRLAGMLADDPADGTAIYFSGWETSTIAPPDTWTYYPGYAPLTASLAASPPATDLGSPVTFSGIAHGGGSAITTTIHFGDGGRSGYLTPTHVYNSTGTFTARLWANDSSTGVVASTTVVINALPAATVAAAPNPVDQGVATTFSASVHGGTGPFLYAWRFGDGGRSTFSTPSHAYNATGGFTASFWANDSAGHSAPATVLLTINTDPTVKASSSAAVADVGVPVTFTATPSGGTPSFTIAWRFGDGGSGTGSPIPHTFGKAGNFTVSVWANDTGGGTATTTLPIQVNRALTVPVILARPDPSDAEVAVVFSPSYGGGTPSYTFSWHFGDGTTSSLPDPTHAYKAAGNYSVELWVDDSGGGNATATPVVLRVDPRLALAGFTGSFAPQSSDSMDLGQSVELSVGVYGGTAPDNFTYFGLPSGCASSDASTLLCVPTVTGSFTVEVEVTDHVGASAFANLTFAVNPTLAVASFSATPSTFSLGVATSLSVSVAGGTSPFTYQFLRLPTGCLSSSAATLPCTPTAPGTFVLEVQVVDSAGGSAFGNSTLTVNPDPAISQFYVTPGNSTVGQQVTFVLVLSGGTAPLTITYTGTPAGCPGLGRAGGSCDPMASGTFRVKVTVEDADGRVATATVTLTVAPGPTFLAQVLGNYWWLFVVVIVCAIAALVLVLERRRRRRSEEAGPIDGGALDAMGAVAPAPEGHPLVDDHLGHPELPSVDDLYRSSDELAQAPTPPTPPPSGPSAPPGAPPPSGADAFASETPAVLPSQAPQAPSSATSAGLASGWKAVPLAKASPPQEAPLPGSAPETAAASSVAPPALVVAPSSPTPVAASASFPPAPTPPAGAAHATPTASHLYSQNLCMVCGAALDSDRYCSFCGVSWS